MIISYRHRFIFIHCRKTAGSSIAAALSRHLGPRDIQLSAIEETLSIGQRPPLRMLLGAMRFQRRDAPALARAYLRRSDAETLARACKRSFIARLGHVPQHANADIVSRTFPAEWAQFSKFCVVRNPYDLAVSDYFWRTRDMAQPPDFETYLEALNAGDSLDGIVPVRIYYNWPRYTIAGKVVADRIVRFENLVPELTEHLRSVGIPSRNALPRFKSTQRQIRSRDKRYQSIYSPRSKLLVEGLYAEELEYFRYVFD